MNQTNQMFLKCPLFILIIPHTYCSAFSFKNIFLLIYLGYSYIKQLVGFSSVWILYWHCYILSGDTLSFIKLVQIWNLSVACVLCWFFTLGSALNAIWSIRPWDNVMLCVCPYLFFPPSIKSSQLGIECFHISFSAVYSSLICKWD